MAFGHTLITSAHSTSAGTSLSTSSYSYVADRLYVIIFVANRLSGDFSLGTTPGVPNAATAGNSFSMASTPGVSRCSVAVARPATSGSTSSSLSTSPTNTAGRSIQVWEITGADVSGSLPLDALVTAQTQGYNAISGSTGATLTCTLNQPVGSNNLSFVGAGTQLGNTSVSGLLLDASNSQHSGTGHDCEGAMGDGNGGDTQFELVGGAQVGAHGVYIEIKGPVIEVIGAPADKLQARRTPFKWYATPHRFKDLTRA